MLAALVRICPAQVLDEAGYTGELGPNVFVFTPEMEMNEIQSVIDTIFKRQTGRETEFSRNRYALLFRPGKYKLDIKIDYYITVLGLGNSPDDVEITGAVRSNTTHGNSVLTNFWRGVENLTIIPSHDSANVWGVSQAAPMRRVHVKGDLQLFDKGYASGGFLADSKVDGIIQSGPQQQWFSRNCEIGSWNGGVWNMMFLGVKGAPEANWPENPYTVIDETPLVREKPYLVHDKKGFEVRVPAAGKNVSGVSWDNYNAGLTIPLKKFHIAFPEKDNSATINKALKAGRHIFLTPGIYTLDESLKITAEGSVLFGIGMPSLVPVNGNAAIESSDVSNLTICGITIDAGPVMSEQLMVIGEPGSEKSHEANPSFLYDIFFRVGGPSEGSAGKCLVINSNNVYIDHTWIWRADHGTGVGWDKNRSANGLVVNGDDVTVYGLFNEHHQEYQTLWNGERGRIYFYQSEMPYDPPTIDAWKHNGTHGYASYKVSDQVKDHEAWGIGIYNVFYDAPVIVDNAIETPVHLEEKIHNKVIFWLNGNKESVVRSIINGKGGQVDVNNRKAVLK